MRFVALFVLLVLGAGYVCSAAHLALQETSLRKTDRSADELVRAKGLFAGKCARCHGVNGRGQTVLGEMLAVPDFTNGKWWKDHGNHDDLLESITKGKGDMPAFSKRLSRQEISLLADYVRYFNKHDD